MQSTTRKDQSSCIKIIFFMGVHRICLCVPWIVFICLLFLLIQRTEFLWERNKRNCWQWQRTVVSQISQKYCVSAKPTENRKREIHADDFHLLLAVSSKRYLSKIMALERTHTAAYTYAASCKTAYNYRRQLMHSLSLSHNVYAQ